MLKKLILTITVILLALFVSSQNINVTGQYIDKKNNPIGNALVSYYTSGDLLLDSTRSLPDGSFALSLDITGVNTHLTGAQLQPPSPNPFMGSCTFRVNASNNSILLITDMNGVIVDKLLLKSKGIYNCSWGGMNSSNQKVKQGTYLISLVQGDNVYTQKVIFKGKTSGGLEANRVTEIVNSHKSTLGQAHINFLKENTSELDIFFNEVTADTTLGVITGNIGPEAISNINETHYTLDDELSWNLNNYFVNDDQSSYDNTGTNFFIQQDSLLGLSTHTEGIFSSTITATDEQDIGLTGHITADVNIELPLNIPDADINEDYQGDTLYANINQYINPNLQYSVTYSLLSQSNVQLIDVSLQDSVMFIDYLQADSSGSSLVGMEVSGNGNVDTIYFTVNVIPMSDVKGYITDILDTLNIGIAGVTIEMTLDSVSFYYDTTDANGYYSIQLPEESTTAYYVTTITNSSYTTFHTWATVESGGADVSEDYTIIPDDFVWELYNHGFRVTTGLGGGFPPDKRLTTHHFLSPPLMHTYSDNVLVGGADIAVQYANLIYNIQNILPTFNPRDVDTSSSNMIEHTSFGYILQDNEFGAYFDNSIPGAGSVARTYDGPRMNKCTSAFRQGAGLTGPDVSVFNQELGSCFGAVLEPDQSSNYQSVFCDPPNGNTYTQDDYDCATVMLDRARVHYRNLSYDASDPQGWDWEMRPDEVQIWYPGTSKKQNQQTFVITVYGEKGEVIEHGAYPLNDVPSRVMKMAKMIFTPQEVEARELQESQLNTNLKSWIEENRR